MDQPARSRTYSGPTRAEVEQAYHRDAMAAAQGGYVPVDEQWGQALGQEHLTVTYHYAPEQAPGVITMLQGLGFVVPGPAGSGPTGSPMPAPSAVHPPLVPPPAPLAAAKQGGRARAIGRRLAGWWWSLSRRGKVVAIVVAVIVFAALAAAGQPTHPSTSPSPGAAVLTSPTGTLTPAPGPTSITPPPTSGTPEPTTVPTATPPPTPVPTVAPAFATITLKGSGDKVPKFSIPEDQAAIATITNRGAANFVVWNLAVDGSENDLLVNVIGNYAGTVLFDTQTGEHSVAFKVNSSGSWTIVVKPLTAARVWNTAVKLAGKGDDVVQLQPPSPGLGALSLTNRGSANFVVYSYDGGESLLVNEIGNYSGQVQLPDGSALLRVESNGTWTALLQ